MKRQVWGMEKKRVGGFSLCIFPAKGTAVGVRMGIFLETIHRKMVIKIRIEVLERTRG